MYRRSLGCGSGRGGVVLLGIHKILRLSQHARFSSVQQT